MGNEKIQEFDGYKIPKPRHFTEEELKELDKERQEKNQKDIIPKSAFIKYRKVGVSWDSYIY